MINLKVESATRKFSFESFISLFSDTDTMLFTRTFQFALGSHFISMHMSVEENISDL